MNTALLSGSECSDYGSHQSLLTRLVMWVRGWL